jgi:membrane-associated protease RseP (regulator of RpoE activity)
MTIAVLPHELVHALVARVTGHRVRRLAFGFGPRLTGITLRGIALDLRLIPAGGYAEIPDLDTAPRAHRALIALAGPVSNLLLAPLLLLAATVAAGARSFEVAAGAAVEIGSLLIGGTAELFAAYAANPADLSALPVGGIPSTLLAANASLEGGLPMFFVLCAALSLAVGVINLLPWPPLDGSIALQ